MSRPPIRNINHEPGLLPHEARYVTEALVRASTARRAAEQEYADAVSDSGGDWAFDDMTAAVSAEVAHQREQAEKHLKTLDAILRAAGMIEYPSPDNPFIQVGSRVTVKINGKFQDTCDITSRYIPNMPSMPPEDDIVLITPESPMGEAMVGRQVGEDIDWKSDDGRPFFGKILGLDQTAQQQSYPQPSAPPA